MALPRFHRLPADKKAELFRVATREFAEHGFDGASLNEILDQAGFSKSSYYYYFEDKEDLFATVIEQFVQKFYDQMPARALDTLTAETFWPAIENYLAGSLRQLLEAPEMIKLFGHINLSFRSSPRFAPILEEGRKFYRLFIGAGQRCGCVRGDFPVEFLVAFIEDVDAFLDRWFLSRTKEITAALVSQHAHFAFDTYRRLLVPAAPAAEARPALPTPTRPRKGGRQSR